MEYISTRNTENSFSFKDVFLKGLAPAGGLFVPKEIPIFSKEDLEELKGSSEPEISTDTEESDDEDVSLENLKEEEAKENQDIKEDTEATNS